MNCSGVNASFRKNTKWMSDKNINEFVDKNNIEVKSALKDKKGRGFNKSFRPNQA